MTTGRTVRVVALLTGLASPGAWIGGSSSSRTCRMPRFTSIISLSGRPRPTRRSSTTVTTPSRWFSRATRRSRGGVHVGAPWYGYPPFDFLTEVLWPFHIRDVRRYCFDLQEATKTRTDDLLNNAEALRLRGWNLPAADRPALPKGQAQPLPPGPAAPTAARAPTAATVPTTRLRGNRARGRPRPSGPGCGAEGRPLVRSQESGDRSQERHGVQSSDSRL